MHKVYLVVLFLFLVSCSDSFIENDKQKPPIESSPIFDYYFKDISYTDSLFSKINLPGSIDFISGDKKNFNGSILFKKVIDIRNVKTNYTFIIEGGIDDYDATYVNGHLIGSSIVYNLRRKYFISKEILNYGENTIEIKFHDTSGFGGFKGRMYLMPEKGDAIPISGTWNYQIIHPKHDDDVLFLNNANLAINPILWDLDFKRDLYSSLEFDDFFWESTNTPIFIQDLKISETDVNGIFWFRKNVTINDTDKDYLISIPKGIDDSEEVYFNGNLVGSSMCYGCPRNYIVKKELLNKGDNIISILLSDINADGGILSPVLLNSGSKSTSIANDWKYKQLYFSQNISIFVNGNKNVFKDDEFLYFSPDGIEIKADDIISKSIISDTFSFTNIILLFLLLVILTLGSINYRLLKSRKENLLIQNGDKIKEDYIFIRADRLNIKLLKIDILYIKAVKDYVKVVTLKKNYLVRKNLKTFNKEVLDNSFKRVSKSIIVNIDKITLLDRNMVYLSDLSFKIGLSYVESVNKLLHK